jgi:hypothetical protein
MADLVNEFNSIGADNFGAGAETEVKVETAKSNAAKYTKEAIQKYEADVQADPTLGDRANAYSNSITIVNSLVYKDTGSLVQKEAGKVLRNEDGSPMKIQGKDGKLKTAKEGRQVETAPKVVGYVIKNTGSDAITIQDVKYAKNEAGEYVATPYTLTLAPEDEAPLNKVQFALLGISPECSLKFANGTLKVKQPKGTVTSDYLEKCYFSFTGATSVHDDDVVKHIADKTGDEWVIKPEYIAEFGYLLNKPAPKAARVKGASAGVKKEAAIAHDILSKYNQFAQEVANSNIR